MRLYMDERTILIKERQKAIFSILEELEKDAAKRRFSYLRQIHLVVSALLGLLIPLLCTNIHNIELHQGMLLLAVVILTMVFLLITLLIYYSQCILPVHNLKSFRKAAPKALMSDDGYVSFGKSIPLWYEIVEFLSYIGTTVGIILLAFSFLKEVLNHTQIY